MAHSSGTRRSPHQNRAANAQECYKDTADVPYLNPGYKDSVSPQEIHAGGLGPWHTSQPCRTHIPPPNSAYARWGFTMCLNLKPCLH